MHNAELFEKICNVTISYEELYSFNLNIDKQEYDLFNPFEKYYSLDSIIKVINLYKNKEITDYYLSCWANAFNWIINGGFKTHDNFESIGLKQLLEWTISDFLDSMSFFDAEEGYNPDGYIIVFNALDKCFNYPQHYEMLIGYTSEYGGNEGDCHFLAINHERKEFVEIYLGLNSDIKKVDFIILEEKSYKRECAKLKRLAYNQIKYEIINEVD